MRTSASLAVLSLLSASAVTATGIVDMVTVAAKLATEAIDLSGDYYIQNVKTGDYLYFERPDDTTNLVTGSTKTTITSAQDSVYGRSGNNYDTWTGSYFTGLSKCMSSQWGTEDSVGLDYAAVSYACVVGDSTSGTDTLEVAKQFWHVIPCGSSSSSSSTSSSASASSTDDSVTVSVELAAKVASKSVAASTVEWSSSADSSAAATTTATSTASAASATVSRDPNDRTTWPCLHPGWWLARHPDYVWTQGKIECKATLLAYYASQSRMHKRSLNGKRTHLGFGENPNKLSKRGDTAYCIIAVDHITDMTTRALTPVSVTTTGDYQSLKLADYDSTDESQWWTIVEA